MQSRRSVAEELRQRIRSGEYVRGSRIPTRRELGNELDVSSLTLQRAFDRLISQGFLVARGKRGTFVADNPPNRACCAMIFGNEPGQSGWNRFWSNMLREGQTWCDEHGRRFEIYSITNGSISSDEHRRLCDDVADGALSGLFFVSSPYFLEGSPIFVSSLPRVTIGNADQVGSYYGSVVTVDRDGGSLFRPFAEAGRKRLAAICTRPAAANWRTYAA